MAGENHHHLSQPHRRSRAAFHPVRAPSRASRSVHARTFDRTSNEWKDGDALFMRCSIWRRRPRTSPSRSACMRVSLCRLKQRSFETLRARSAQSSR